MNKLSIKTQIILWYSLSIMLISGVLFFAYYKIAEDSLIKETDRSLLSHSIQLSQSLPSTDSNLTCNSDMQIPGMFTTLATAEGKIMNSSDSDEYFVALAKEAIMEQKPVYQYHKYNSMQMRFISYPIINDGKISSIILMGHPVDIYESALITIRNIAMLTLVGLIIPSIILGYLLARRSVNPILNITRKLDYINAENLTQRIQLPNRSQETFLLSKNLNSLLERLNTSLQREKQFVGDVAHEIKTPLSVIKSNTQITLNKQRNLKEYEESLGQILDKVNNLSTRLSGMIDLAWTDAEEIKKQFTKVNLTSLINSMAESTEILASTKNIKVKTNVENNIFIKGKEDKLAQVFYNLIDNAVKFTPEKGEINISLFSKKFKAIVEITDTGVGIDKKDIRNIFNRYFRSGKNETIKGHGLGLAIAYNIVRTHNGTLTVVSEKGKGSIFKVTLDIF